MGSSGTSFTNVGDSLLGPFASRKPRQYERQYQTFDPLGSESAQAMLPDAQAALRRGLGGRGVGQSPMTGDLYAKPGAQQTGALNRIEGYGKQAEPLYGTSVRGLEETAGGQYLDVAGRPEFQRMADARRNMAQSFFSDQAADINANKAARGNFTSSARTGQLGREAGRIGTQAEQDIAQAGFGQYGAERGLQQQAQTTGAQLAPGMAGQVFAGAETLRGARQGANVAQAQQDTQRMGDNLRAQLGAMGMDNQAIENVLKYLQVASGKPIESVVGSSPYDENLKRLQTESSAFGNIMGG